MGGYARFLIQQAMKAEKIGYRELTERLSELFHEPADEKVIGTKIGRGTFSAAFFLMCMSALKHPEIKIKPEDIAFFFRNARPDGGLDQPPSE